MKALKPKKLKILIAEDEEFSSIFLQVILKNIASQILRVTTGVNAIDICKNNTDIDLILMDIKMPTMNGYLATKEIRKFNKDVIIIAQTAYGLASDRKKAIDAGCNEYISKPINKDKLMEIIDRLFA